MSAPGLHGKKVLLTGASGFIGGSLRTRLLADGAEVIAVRRKGSPPAKKGRSVEVEYEDLPELERLFSTERPDCVLHVAGATKGRTYEDFRRANVMPTENLLKAALAGHPSLERFVHVSSASVYGPSVLGEPPLDESAPRKPIEHYGKSKLEAEEVVERFAGQLKCTIIRPAGVYGPGDGDFFNLFREANSGRNIFFGNRQKWCSLVYVDDLVDVILLAAQHPKAVGKGFFVCDEHPTTWDEFQGHILAAVGRKKAWTIDFPAVAVDVAAFFGELATRLDKKPRLFNRQKALMGFQNAWLCTSKAAQAELGYLPKVALREGCERAASWYRQEGWLK